ncbi:unnamed protein product [Closterium sp. NIES-54]
MPRAQRESRHKVKVIRTDNGGDFIGADFESVLKKKGIQHQLTVPYNPQQNGVAERFNRTLQEGARTLLGRAGLLDPFWVTALQQVVCDALGLAEKYGLQDGGKPATPLPSGFTVEPCADEEVVGESDRKSFHSMVGALNYVANHTRPDIAFATSRLASVVSRLSHEQLEAAKRLVRYVSATASVGLEYSAVRQRLQRGAADLGKREMLLTCYTDASFNSVKADGTSIGGYVCLFGGSAVSWRSKKQNELLGRRGLAPPLLLLLLLLPLATARTSPLKSSTASATTPTAATTATPTAATTAATKAPTPATTPTAATTSTTSNNSTAAPITTPTATATTPATLALAAAALPSKSRSSPDIRNTKDVNSSIRGV